MSGRRIGNGYCVENAGAVRGGKVGVYGSYIDEVVVDHGILTAVAICSDYRNVISAGIGISVCGCSARALLAIAKVPLVSDGLSTSGVIDENCCGRRATEKGSISSDVNGRRCVDIDIGILDKVADTALRVGYKKADIVKARSSVNMRGVLGIGKGTTVTEIPLVRA